MNEVRELFEFVASNGRSVLNYYGGSRAASTVEDKRETEIADGLILSKRTAKEKEPIVIDLQEYARSKAANTAVNPVREIFDFLNGRH